MSLGSKRRVIEAMERDEDRGVGHANAIVDERFECGVPALPEVDVMVRSVCGRQPFHACNPQQARRRVLAVARYSRCLHLAAEQFSVGDGEVGVADHGVSFDQLNVVRLVADMDAHDRPVGAASNALHWVRVADVDARLLDGVGESGRHLMHAALRDVDAPDGVHVGNNGVDSERFVWGEAGVHRLERKDALEALVVEERSDLLAELAEAVTSFADAVAARDTAIGELRRTQDELVQAGKMAALGTMSAGLAHELNQPLGALRQRAYLAGRAIARKDMPKAQAQVDKINDLVERMEAIISHLRRFARRAEIEKGAVKLGDAVDGAATFLKNRLSDGGASLEVTQDARQLVVQADPVLLEQVIVNLISNASDAIAETDMPGTITIDQSASTPGVACFTVTDTGVGLSDIAADQAFDPFVTSKDPGLGMGLGLSISYNIMTGMGGTLRLEPAKRTGTRAVATLPIGGAL